MVGAVTLSAIGFTKVGGFQGLWEKYPLALGNISSNAALTSMNISSTAYKHIIKPYKGSLLYTNNSFATNVTHKVACYDVDNNW